MKPESVVPAALGREQTSNFADLDDLPPPSPLTSAERRRLFMRRTSEDLIQLQEAAQKVQAASSKMTNDGDFTDGIRGDSHAEMPIRTRSILKTGRQSSRSPSPHRRVRFHNDVLVWAAAEDGELSTVKTLLKSEKALRSSGDKTHTGLDINMSNHENVTLLHLLCFLQDTDAVATVLEMGADTNAVDREGWTPLHIAVALNQPKLARLLVQHGAEVQFSGNNSSGRVLELSKVSNGPHVTSLIEELQTLSVVHLALAA